MEEVLAKYDKAPYTEIMEQIKTLLIPTSASGQKLSIYQYAARLHEDAPDLLRKFLRQASAVGMGRLGSKGLSAHEWGNLRQQYII